MELNILKIASDTSNMKKLNYFTHSAKTRNPMCGDNITFKINLKKNFVKDVGYESKSCIYCQASASLLSKYILNKDLLSIRKTVKNINDFYNNQEIIIKGNLIKVFNKKNYKRRECIYLPVKAIYKALKIKN